MDFRLGTEYEVTSVYRNPFNMKYVDKFSQEQGRIILCWFPLSHPTHIQIFVSNDTGCFSFDLIYSIIQLIASYALLLT